MESLVQALVEEKNGLSKLQSMKPKEELNFYLPGQAVDMYGDAGPGRISLVRTAKGFVMDQGSRKEALSVEQAEKQIQQLLKDGYQEY
jgi:hypothetical protein